MFDHCENGTSSCNLWLYEQIILCKNKNISLKVRIEFSIFSFFSFRDRTEWRINSQKCFLSFYGVSSLSLSWLDNAHSDNYTPLNLSISYYISQSQQFLSYIHGFFEAFWGWSCILLFALFCLCDPLSLIRIICGTTGLGAAHWSLGGSSVGTQVTAMTGRIPVNLSLICTLLFRSHVPCRQLWLLWGHYFIPRHQYCLVLFCVLYLNISPLFYNVA